VVIILAAFTVVVVFRQTQALDEESPLDRLLPDQQITPTPLVLVTPTSTPIARRTPTPTPDLGPLPTPRPTSTPADPDAERPTMKIASVPVFADGTFTGTPVRMNYGIMQLSVTMQDQRLEAIEIVKYPNATTTSIAMSRELLSGLVERAVAEQEWKVDSISGATQTLRAFQKALVFALRAAAAK